MNTDVIISIIIIISWVIREFAVKRKNSNLTLSIDKFIDALGRIDLDNDSDYIERVPVEIEDDQVKIALQRLDEVRTRNSQGFSDASHEPANRNKPKKPANVKPHRKSRK